MSSGTTLLPNGNTLPDMAKKPLKSVLADNVRELMKSRPELSSSPKLGSRSGIAQRTINNVEKARFDPKLSTVEAIARALNIEPHQLLCPGIDRAFYNVCVAWNQASELERDLLLGAAETIKRRHGQSSSHGKTDER